MKILQAIFFVCFIFLASSAEAQNFGDRSILKKQETTAPPPAKIDAPFDRIQDNAWALVLTGPEEDPLFIEQLALLQPSAATLIMRKIVVIRFHGRTLKIYPELSEGEYQLPSLKGAQKSESSHKKIERLESLLHTDDDVFSVVLVGIDGATKYIWNVVVTPEEIFNVMDHPELISQEMLDRTSQ